MLKINICSYSLIIEKKTYINVGTYRKTPSIDMNILSGMKMKGTVGYAPNPNNRKRNQVISHVINMLLLWIKIVLILIMIYNGIYI